MPPRLLTVLTGPNVPRILYPREPRAIRDRGRTGPERLRGQISPQDLAATFLGLKKPVILGFAYPRCRYRAEQLGNDRAFKKATSRQGERREGSPDRNK